MTRSTFASLCLIPVLFGGLAACGGDDGGPMESPTTYNLTFTGDETFHNAHGGQTIHVGVREGSGTLVASETGTVSATETPAFSFTFTNALEAGEDYDLEYWIDSNFGDGGTEGQCDPPSVDHQWSIDIAAVTDDVTIDDMHRPSETEDVCSSSSGGGEIDGPGY